MLKCSDVNVEMVTVHCDEDSQRILKFYHMGKCIYNHGESKGKLQNDPAKL